MSITTNLKKYIFFSITWSVAFFATLHWALFNATERWPIITVAAFIYGTGFGAVGWLLSKTDSAHRTRLNLGLAYYFVSNLASLVIGGIWVLFFKREEWFTLLLMTLVFVSLSIIAHFNSRNTVKGIEKNQLFQ